MTGFDFFTLLPQTQLLVWASLLLIVDLFIPRTRKVITAILAAVGLAISLALVLTQMGTTRLGYSNMAAVDGFSILLNILFTLTGMAVVAITHNYLKKMDILKGEFYSLILFSISGMMLMASAADLIMVFLALELLSIPLYILAGFAVPRTDSEEAAMKYFLLGAFSGGFVLYGTALVYGATGFTDLKSIVSIVQAGTQIPILFLAGSGLILVGFSFKMAIVPFHMWTPDVYQGSPSPVTGFMSVGAKAAGFAALMRVFTIAFPALSSSLIPILAVLAALTMIVGNIGAVSQKNIKRMLAYSSIAHAGYLLMAFTGYNHNSGGTNSVASILFYLFAYAFTSLGAWGVVTLLEKSDSSGLEIKDYAGLAKKQPVLSAAMAVFMLSFTGMPPMLGFWGKFYLFRTAIESGYLWLAILGLITSLVSAWYYLRVIVMMYMQPGEASERSSWWGEFIPALAALALIILGLIPGWMYSWVVQAVIHI